MNRFVVWIITATLLFFIGGCVSPWVVEESSAAHAHQAEQAWREAHGDRAIESQESASAANRWTEYSRAKDSRLRITYVPDAETGKDRVLTVLNVFLDDRLVATERREGKDQGIVADIPVAGGQYDLLVSVSIKYETVFRSIYYPNYEEAGLANHTFKANMCIKIPEKGLEELSVRLKKTILVEETFWQIGKAMVELKFVE